MGELQDRLTGLHSGTYLLQILDGILGHNGQVVLMLANIDGCHAFNYYRDHIQGDEEIKRIGQEIKALAGERALVCRWGGDEFAVVFYETSLEDAREIAEQIRARCQPIIVGDEERSVSTYTLSIGLAHFPDQASNSTSLIEAAELALLKAKKGGTLADGYTFKGRNRVIATDDFLSEPTDFIPDGFRSHFAHRLKAKGYEVKPDVLRSQDMTYWRDLVGSIEGKGVSKRESVFAIRNLLDVPKICELARSPQVRNLIEPILGKDCFAVRGIFFDKTPDANWKVPYHQDLSIAVQEKVETEGFGPWSEKAGAVHVQPPARVLEKMLTIRIHLDDTDESNGALRVIPGSHLSGKIASGAVAAQAEQGEVLVPVPEGGAMLMRPLLLHASSPAQNAKHRRVIHLEFAGVELPGDLKWLYRV